MRSIGEIKHRITEKQRLIATSDTWENKQFARLFSDIVEAEMAELEWVLEKSAKHSSSNP